MAGTENVFSRPPAAAAGGAAPQSSATQADGLLSGGWNELAKDLTRVYALSAITPARASAAATTADVVAPQQTPRTVVSARPNGIMGFLGSPMGLVVVGGVALGAFFLLRKR